MIVFFNSLNILINTMEDDRSLKFSSIKLEIGEATLKAIKKMGFKRMTNIQAAALPKLLAGCDIVASAKTGSGKTLAFLIPQIAVVRKQLENNLKGTFGIILSPTRELAIQTHTVIKELLLYQDYITSALVIGGESRKKQAIELSKGVNIVVATPGRLLDHMRNKEFDYKNVKCLVMDEADKIMQYGFEEDLKQIINLLPKDRQTMLFSATTSEKTVALTNLATNGTVVFVNTDEDDNFATVEGLKQGYVICKTEDRLWWLFKVLKKTSKQKVMVFFSSCKSVEFHYELFNNHCHAPVTCIHGKMCQEARSAAVADFAEAARGTLLCTDVAARGLDIPAVDWVVQYDPPAHTAEYIHRVGRTARGEGAIGNAVLLLRPEEKKILLHLQNAKVYLELYKMWDNFHNLQPMLENIVDNNPEFHELAIEACEGYVKAFEVRKLKDVFDVITLDLNSVAKSFGLKQKPDIDIRTGFKKKHRKRKKEVASLENCLTKSKYSKI